MYPTPSMRAMRVNMMTICGMKVRTPPTPPMMPSPSSPASIGAGASSQVWTCVPSQPKLDSIASLKGSAQVKIAWKKRYMTVRNTSVPHTGCSRTRSTAAVRRSSLGGM